MNLNQDVVPVTLDEAVKLLVEALTVDEVREIKDPKSDAISAHHTWGQLIRNEWSIWEKDTKMVKWFEQNFGLTHADDISGLILDCLWQDVNGRPRRTGVIVKKLWNGSKDKK